MQTTIYAVIFYVATAIFAAGLVLRVWQYARTPVPLKIPTTPAPTTRAGAMLRMLREVTVFESLFKSNKWIWLFGWVFHVSLALVLFRHLRYFTEPVWPLVSLMQPFGLYAGFAMVAALFALWVRRVTMAHMRYIRYRVGKGLYPRAYGLRLAAASGRSAAPHSSGACRGAEGHLPLLEASARPWRLLQPLAQSGRQSSRAPLFKRSRRRQQGIGGRCGPN